MSPQTTIFDDTVASRIEQLLERVDSIRRGTEIDRPIHFDAAGERHARKIARRDASQAPKPVDTALAPTAAAHSTARSADVRRADGTPAVPVTGASSRLRQQRRAAQ